MNKRFRLLIMPAVILLAACGGRNSANLAPTTSPATAAPAVESLATDSATTTAAATLPKPAGDATATVGSLAMPTRIGVDYVLLLPREAAVPSDWIMNPIPNYEIRRPAEGDTYQFACEDLTARSIGQTSVGYRHLEGLPSVNIEYVIYPTDEVAAAALSDMEGATERCAEFTIGDGDGATAAAFAPLEFPSYGDGGFARALTTHSPITGDLLTHMIKVRQGHVVIGINHTHYAGEPPPDAALTESLVALAVNNLDNGPSAPGP